MISIDQAVRHWNHGDGIVVELLAEGCVKCRFDTGVRMISEENLTDTSGRPLAAPPPQSACINYRNLSTFLPHLPHIAEISDDFSAYLVDTGVDIRVMAAPEHETALAYLLERAGSQIPDGFECVAVGENGGLTRPWAPGFVCRFKTPPEGLCKFHFRDELNGFVSTASTSFALGLIKRGFPITMWKGKP